MIAKSNNIESIMNWFNNTIREGENSIVIYPNLQSFRQIYTQYIKDELLLKTTGNGQSLLPRIILFAAFYEDVKSVKHGLAAVGIDIQRHITDGSLLIVDAFNSYHPDLDGMKKLIASLSERATREGREGVSVIVNMGFFFLYGGDGKATELINYEASLPTYTDDGNVRGYSCYNAGDFNTLTKSQKEQLAQGQKKMLEVRE